MKEKDTALIIIDYYFQLVDAGFTPDEAYQQMLNMFQRINGLEGYTKIDYEQMLNDGTWSCVFNRIIKHTK